MFSQTTFMFLFLQNWNVGDSHWPFQQAVMWGPQGPSSWPEDLRNGVGLHPARSSLPDSGIYVLVCTARGSCGLLSTHVIK